MRFRQPAEKAVRPAPSALGRRGPSLRLAAMLGGLLLVLSAMTQLRQPETHRAIGQVLGQPAVMEAVAKPKGEPLVPAKAYADVIDNSPFRDAEQKAWFATMAAVAGQDAVTLRDLSLGVIGYAALSSQPEAYRGRIVSVTGTVREIEATTPATNDLGVETLWRVTLEPEGGEVWPITVYTLEEPAAADTPYAATAAGVFFKKLSYRWSEGVGSTPVLIAKRLDTSYVAPSQLVIAPAPVEPDAVFDEPAIGSIGRSLLGDLGVEPAALETIVDRQPLLSRESDAFYAMLAAVDRTPAAQLVRLARVGLDDYVARRGDWADGSTRDRKRLMAVQTEQQQRGYSVVPLFGDAARERGELIVLDAVVRRTVRIDATLSQAANNAGVDHYYELEAFPEDSQNLPIVFVVRDLPAGFPVGESIRQPARLAGFFFKQWAYRTRQRVEGTANLDKRQFAPLLVGRAPIPLATPDASQQRPGLAIGVVATLALAGVVTALWRLGRRDRVYASTTLSRYREPEESLDFERLEHLNETP